jgi:hypothetical protein
MLTQQHLQAIKADIALDPVLSTLPHNSDSAFAVAEAYNLTAAPEFVVWKTAVDPDDIMRNGMDWTRVDNLSVGKARIWDWMTKLGAFDASKVNIRAGIDATWVGTSADLAVRAMVYTHCKRPATLAEKILATGTGTTEVPATMGYEGNLGIYDVKNAMDLP